MAVAAGAQRADHSAFDALLKANVVNGMVDYDAFRAASSFPKYLALLAATDPSTLPRDEQLAFWINAYNAYTIELIISHNERKSIRNINCGTPAPSGAPARLRMLIGSDTTNASNSITKRTYAVAPPHELPAPAVHP